MTNPQNNQQIPQVEVQTETPSPLDNAPDEIKLAVDLIYLLESNEVDKETAIKALEIVLSDFKNK
ncbi:pleiotropic regulatory protein RsmS [Aliivibrio fischeri]|uniref:pleiotropic regulatory protein RsmS n=1 Tax=Aliivibrio fischeri TaxID=668 RepID=UPI0007C50D43|nr:pleiotropic regulatory protein RsmS [Aliivibrio fischeri]MBP3141570.1 pleiotropic regulatory protein RsmS [Aliivibrio fischeri]MBP3157811.1 pleiotropic regulatory protein RsmS [Aliivibrio fischeri]MCE7572558.1 pleiotropic regulatory protein RsmS [Aliivibrio fischeri]MUK38078.1 pleiotropic regulatory protein RsmS [Aliivibrio fischeri]MUL04558.1 pleiotropic regulatory protein RsmS [Aliivibrio fischeri]